MKGGRVLLAATSVLLFASMAAGSNQGLSSGGYGASLGAGGAMAAERCGWGQSPAALRPGQRGILLGTHRPFGLEEVRVMEAGGFWDLQRAGFGGTWRQTGVEDLFLEQGFEGQASWRFGGGRSGFPGRLDVGGALTWWRQATAGRPGIGRGEQGYGLVWKPFPRLGAGAFVRGLSFRKSDYLDGESRNRIMQCGLQAESRPATQGGEGPAQVLRFDLRRTGDTDWRALASLSVRPHQSFEITSGLASAPFQFSLGIRLDFSGIAFHQAFRQHRDLGATWLGSIAFASGSRQEPIQYP